LIEYAVNMALWSDGTKKRRWIGIPNDQRIGFSPTGAWTFPIGTILVKHFEMEMTEGDSTSARRLETRVFIRRDSGWEGFTYRWNSTQTDANLLAGAETETLAIQTSTGVRQQLYTYPSRTDCLRCHTEIAGSALGVITRQINREFDFSDATDNQLRTYNHINYFTTNIGSENQYRAYPEINDEAVTLTTRARAYLDVNCSHCHRPNGPSPVNIDLRFDTVITSMNTLNAMPQGGDLGISGARIIAPGNKEISVLWQRMRRLDEQRMPPLASHRVDEEGTKLIGDWIDSL
jgi:uncharacterized repeat protein (TIGR03806 family)